ncbi:hypothetical protein L0244_20810, partial [bacterium]|nr:hypothetical protein [bacterium]
MKITNSNHDPFRIGADAHAILVHDEQEFTRSGDKANSLLKGNLKSELKTTKFQIRKRNSLLYYTGLDLPSRIICVAIKKEEPYSVALREAAYTAVKAACSHGLSSLALAFDSGNESETQAVTEGALLASYQYLRYKTDLRYKTANEKKSGLSAVTICTRKLQPNAIRNAEVNYGAVSFVKDLVNEPPDSLTPAKFAKEAEKIAHKNKLKLRVFLSDELEKMGAFSFLSVGKGSKQQG